MIFYEISYYKLIFNIRINNTYYKNQNLNNIYKYNFNKFVSTEFL